MAGDWREALADWVELHPCETWSDHAGAIVAEVVRKDWERRFGEDSS